MGHSGNGSAWTPKRIAKDLDERSGALREMGLPHLFWILEETTDQVQFWSNLSMENACHVVELIARTRGGEVLDRVVDKLLQEGE